MELEMQPTAAILPALRQNRKGRFGRLGRFHSAEF